MRGTEGEYRYGSIFEGLGSKEGVPEVEGYDGVEKEGYRASIGELKQFLPKSNLQQHEQQVCLLNSQHFLFLETTEPPGL